MSAPGSATAREDEDARTPTATAPRVVITGMGVVSAIGIGLEQFADGLRSGRRAVLPITAFSTEGFNHHNGCEVTGFDPARWIRRVPLVELSKAARFSVAAARMAVLDAGLADEQLRRQRALVAVGTTDGGSDDLEGLVAVGLEQGFGAFPATVARRYPAAQLSNGIVAEFGLTDVEAVTVPTACASGNYAIGYGLDALRCGDVDIALAGGADAMCRRTFAAFCRLGTIAPDACRPFDVDRQGLLPGEGAAILVLETLESALARGARIHAEILGYGLTCDATHPTAPDRDGITRTIRAAHRDAGTAAEHIDYVSAHGTGTMANDVTEVAALRQAFGDVPLPPVVGLKSMLGHAMGAASAIATAACALSMTHGFIPPTVNHENTDPDCAVDCVPNHARPANPAVVQNNGLAFNGNNAVLILGRYPRPVAEPAR
ncbi:beta-ketoacyl-[acyl-carrier-protein] synthase family protein [Dactylosporangium roseum]|uniref:Beta-ketoacyl-[acyl-carrier-protein] synthase family protein n=1 Tax=Dactylosporangium roseum TaxID=47989 RepID=A0ABY5Z106_9ACTN|nr:beta-ketoacyl-[acyl-carrier-protein] synthase family protein [Dactylosporangium roseum]UWZ34768.1 beta-ketoacyl-[acyl-carrier-protein] synthase family protein [Dactylosporangium roseum]